MSVRVRGRGESVDGGRGGDLVLTGVTKVYGDVTVVDMVSLEVQAGEFVTLLGPSGSGKTTTMRMVAGFIRLTCGSIMLDGKNLAHVPPYKRDIGMVFQNYALFPHMTAADNIAFPLAMRRQPKATIRERVAEVLKLVRLEGLGDRYPKQLSGGQQQRVALARALSFEPRLLLMDEPLGALDKKLREALQLEIIRISRELGVTVLYVTHDQSEALVMSDRVAIYNEGRVEQIGTGEDLYERPASLFVATFIGESNILRGTLTLGPGSTVKTPEGQTIRVPDRGANDSGLSSGDHVAVIVRPERMVLRSQTGAPTPSDGDLAADLPGRIREVIYLGSERRYLIDIEGGHSVTICVQETGDAVAMTNPEVRLGWRVRDCVVVADPGWNGTPFGEHASAPEGQRELAGTSVVSAEGKPQGESVHDRSRSLRPGSDK